MWKITRSFLLLLLLVTFFVESVCLQFQGNPVSLNPRCEMEMDSSRRSFFPALALCLFSASSFSTDASAKSYSANARNLERLNAGDMSGGSVYDNNPKSDAGKRRRALTGCKSPIAREEAALNLLKLRDLSEKACNQMVLEGNSDFMLQALQNLACPSCPYGIKNSR